MRLLLLFMAACILFTVDSAQADEQSSPVLKTFSYHINSGDNLAMIAMLFTGSENWVPLARLNNLYDPEFIHPGEVIEVPTTGPIAVLKKYLSSIYDHDYAAAYEMLFPRSRARYPYDEFERALKSATMFDLDTVEVCAHSLIGSHHVVRLSVQLQDDSAIGSFNVIMENGTGQILLLDPYPTFPHNGTDVQYP